MIKTCAFLGRIAAIRNLRLLLILPLILVSACAQTSTLTTDAKIERGADGLSVLLMPADVEISLLTAGGLLEPNAEWTEQGRQNVVTALGQEMAERNIDVISYAEQNTSNLTDSDNVQMIKLHEAVGNSIARHKFTPGQELPTKENKFDWTLGEGVQSIKESVGGDYALFVRAEDSFSSGGRVAMQIAFALLGASLPGGRQIVFASLVDLESGDVVWYNVLTKGVGDLRDPKLAAETIDSLMESAPL